MTYSEILENIAKRENISVKEVEKEMRIALSHAGIKSPVKDFVKETASALFAQTIYRI